MRLHSLAVKETLGEILSISLVRNHRGRGDSISISEQRAGAPAEEGRWRQKRNREEESKDWRIWRWKPEPMWAEEDRPPPTEKKIPQDDANQTRLTCTFFYQLIQSGFKFNGDTSSSFCGIIQRASLQFILWNQESRLVLRCGRRNLRKADSVHEPRDSKSKRLCCPGLEVDGAPARPQ